MSSFNEGQSTNKLSIRKLPSLISQFLHIIFKIMVKIFIGKYIIKSQLVPTM